MITVDFSTKGSLSLTEHIYRTIKEQILNSTLPADSRLPSKRSLADHLGVSIITIQNAYGLLISEGYIYSIEKKGFFVTDISEFTGKTNERSLVLDSERTFVIPDSTKLTDDSHLIHDFTSNTISSQNFPFALWSHTMRQILNSGDEKLLARTGIKGAFELRSAIAGWLKEFRNMTVDPEQIVIGAGAESLYSILVQFLGRDKIYAVENPGFNKTKAIFELNGAACVPVDIDSQGISPELLTSSKANVVHLSPNHHFPTGIVMPVRRRMELLNWVNSSPDNFIIEDDYDSEFRFNGKPLPTLQSLSPQSSIIYMNTFSKSLSPSFRIGFMVLPAGLVQKFEQKLSTYSCSVSSFEQFTLARFITEKHFEKHINRMKNHYRTLRNNLISEFKKSGLLNNATIQEQESGLHFLLNITTSTEPEILQSELLKEGIRVPLLQDFYYTNPRHKTCSFVINYSSLPKEAICTVAQKISKIIKSVK